MTTSTDLIAERDRLASIGRTWHDLDDQPTATPPTVKKRRHRSRTTEPTVAEQRAEYYATMRATRRAEYGTVRH